MRNTKEFLANFSARFRRPLFGFSAFAILVAAFALLKFIIHIVTAQGYGYFADELYAIAMSKHLAFSFVDMPPLTPFLVAISRALFGESLLAYSIFPALAGSATLVFVCLMTRELGGKLFATVLSALGFMIAPLSLSLNSVFTYDGISLMVLSLFVFVLVRLVKTGNTRLWIGIGLVAGIAFMTKVSIMVTAPGILVALLGTRRRKDFLTPWPWIAVGLFALVISPWVVWEAANHWVTFEFWYVHTHSYVKYSILDYLINIALNLNPVLVPLLAIGLYRIFRRFGDTSYGFFGILFLVTVVVVYLFHFKVSELGHLFMPLLASGAVFVEEKLARVKFQRALETVVVSCLLAAGIIEAPLSLPVLPLDQLAPYSQTFGFLYKPVKEYDFEQSPYPVGLSMRIGWEELVQKVAEVYNGLPEEDRKKAVIYGSWYATASAIDVLGPKHGLPNAVSGHQTYFLWGPGDKTWEVVIFVTGGILPEGYAETEIKATVENAFAMPFYNHIIFLCRQPLPGQTKEVIWNKLKYLY